MPIRLRISSSMAAFTALPFHLTNASFTVIVEMSQRCSGSACMSGSSYNSSSSSSASSYSKSSSTSSYAVVKAASTKKSGGLQSRPVRRSPGWTSTTSLSVDSSTSPPSSPAALPSASCCTTVGVPADFSPAIVSPTDCPVADCSVVGVTVGYFPVDSFFAGASFAGFTKVGCTSSTYCSLVGATSHFSPHRWSPTPEPAHGGLRREEGQAG
ncbi:unnamed protein product [Closterium sp. NIES-54]